MKVMRYGAVLFSLMVLFSCNRGVPREDRLDPENPVTLTIWHYYNGPQKRAFDQMVILFNETEGYRRGISIEAFSQGGINQLFERVEAAALKEVGSARMPDIFAAYADFAYTLDKLGVTADLAPYISSRELSKYVDSYVEEGYIDSTGGLTIFPTAKSTEVLMLNKTDWDIFAEATGVLVELLDTWEGVAKVARAYYEWTDSLTPEPGDGRAFFGIDAFANYMIIGAKQLGDEIFTFDQGSVVIDLDREVFRRLWDAFYIPYINGYYTASGRFRSDDLKIGAIIAAVCSSTGGLFFPDEVTYRQRTYPIECLVLPVPGFVGTLPMAVQQGAGMVVSKSTPKKERAAVEFLKWFTDEERNTVFAVEAGYTPVKKAANDPKVIRKALESLGHVPSQLYQTLTVAAEQVQGYTLYTNKPFPGGIEARALLETSMVRQAQEDRKQLDLIGETSEVARFETLSRFSSTEHFGHWFDVFHDTLLSIVETASTDTEEGF